MKAYHPEPGKLVLKAAMRSKPKKDIFPTTDRSWIAAQLDQGADGLAETNQHIMSVYAEPLKAYYNGSTFHGTSGPDSRGPGDADELVASFFADRLGRRDYLDKWQASGRKLRHWLIVGFRHFLMEQRAVRKMPVEADAPSASREGGTMADHVADSTAADPEQVFHREVARVLVRKAIAITEEQCVADDLAIHWRTWVRHVVDGCTYRELAEELGHGEVRLKVMSRTAGNRFRQCMRELLAWPGASPEQLDEEIQELIGNLAKDDL